MRVVFVKHDEGRCFHLVDTNEIGRYSRFLLNKYKHSHSQLRYHRVRQGRPYKFIISRKYNERRKSGAGIGVILGV